MKKIAILLVAMLLAFSLPLAFADSHEDAPADEGAGDEEDDAGDDEAGDEEEDEAGEEEEEEEEAGDCPEGFTCVDAICVDDARLECPDEAVVGDQRGGRKTTICHVPPGNPANRHTIVVGNAAVPAHLAHGDFLGACECEATDEEPLACSVDEEEEEDTEDDAGDEEDDAGDDEAGDEEDDAGDDEAGDEEEDEAGDEEGDEEGAGDEEDERELALLEEIRDLLREIRELLRGLFGGEE